MTPQEARAIVERDLDFIDKLEFQCESYFLETGFLNKEEVLKFVGHVIKSVRDGLTEPRAPDGKSFLERANA